MKELDMERKLGFIVEGDTDRIIVESFAQRLLPEGWRFHTVRLGGKAALPWAYTTVLMFLEEGYEHVIIVFDTDSLDEMEIARQKWEVVSTLEAHQVAHQTTVCPAVPVIEAWLLDDTYDGWPESLMQPQAALARQLGVSQLSPPVIRRQAMTLNIERAARRNSSLQCFITAIRNITQRSHEPAYAPVLVGQG
ncbi:MAG TPA: hypothetical protein ENJ31_11510 [Anaerolineae bacterium]|nr:hypothetical protein [Anaerolineae bacterium]